MIRPLTCICLLLAGGSGLYLYQSKHRAQMLDREIERTLKATDVARDRIGVLRGEWALLNEPERLAALSQSHLELKSLAPTQYVTAAELGARLPPPAAPGTVYAPGYAPGEDEAPVQAVEALPEPPAPAAPPMPARPATTPAKAPPVPPAAPPRTATQVASILQPPTTPLPPPRPVSAHSILAPVVNVSALEAPPTPRPVPGRFASNSPSGMGSGPAAAPPRSSTQTPQGSSPGSSIGESVARMARLQAGTQAPSAAAPAAQPSYNPPSSSQASSSALGGVRPLLAPPVPFGSAMAASVASAR